MNAKISNGDSKSVLTMGELLWDMLPTGKKAWQGRRPTSSIMPRKTV